jgi:iduronate 2-sulfatase
VRNKIILLSLTCILSLNSFCQEKNDYNFLFIVIDDLRAELGSYGSEYVKSPNIDALASKSIVYKNAYSQYAHCSPSRSSFLTGLRPDSTGIYNLDDHIRDVVPDVVTMPQLLKQHGYKSIGMGKIFHNNKNDEDSWNEFHNNFYGYYLDQQNLEIVNSTGKGPAFESADVNDDKYKDGQMTKLAVSKLREFKDDKFILSVGFIKPHLPFNAPKKYWDMYEGIELPLSNIHSRPSWSPKYSVIDTEETRSYYGIPKDIHEPFSEELSKNLMRSYYACISYIDAQVGILLEELYNLGLEENTIVILTSDHGFKLGEYGVWGKHSNMEFDTKVPLMIHHPEMTPGENDDIVELLDLYPTIADMAGIESSTMGESLFMEERKQIAISQMFRDYVPVMGYSIRKDDFRYVFWVEDGKIIDEEFFDHQLDPNETVNQIELLPQVQRLELLKEFNKYNYTNPIDIDQYVLSIPNHKIELSLNASIDQITFTFPRELNLDGIHISIFNLNGTKVIDQPACRHTCTINFNGNKGVLLYLVTKNGKTLKSGKFLNK